MSKANNMFWAIHKSGATKQEAYNKVQDFLIKKGAISAIKKSTKRRKKGQETLKDVMTEHRREQRINSILEEIKRCF